jgi:hypothetical protein
MWTGTPYISTSIAIEVAESRYLQFKGAWELLRTMVSYLDRLVFTQIEKI